MKIDPTIVGHAFAPMEREVGWRQSTNYAAAIGDDNPCYLDDTDRAKFVAHPLFAVAMTWPFMERVQGELDGAIPPEAFLKMVHATEHLVFHKPMRPGEVLSIEGEIAAVLPSKAGTHVVINFQAVDSVGEPVFDEFAGVIFRGIDCDGEGRGAENLPQHPDLTIDRETLWQEDIAVSRGLPFIYDGCSDIVFPIHTSVSFAKMVGLPDIIVQGTALLAIACRELVNHECGADPTRLKEIACLFRAPVIPDSNIQVRLAGKKEGDDDAQLGFELINAQGKQSLSRGFAKVAL